MKAIVQDRYGPPEKVFALREIDRPVPGDDEVLVRVRATCVHPDVWHAVTGRPWALRLMGAGAARPNNPVPGMDVAGTVEAAGKDVTRFEPGDEVFGATHVTLLWRNGGSFAEYAAVPQAALARKPAKVTFEQAATVPTSGFIALLNTRGGALIPRGGSMLVNGAGGGVGSIAVQLGKIHGARVTGVDRAEKLEMVRALGADEVIDYTTETFDARGERYDLILDVASTLTLSACAPALTSRGIYVFIGHDHFGRAKGRVLGSIPRALGLFAMARFSDHLPKRSASPPPTIASAMPVLAELLEQGKLTPIVARTFPLAEAGEAMLYLQSGRARGRTVITP